MSKIIADGNYIREHRSILKQLNRWNKMTDAEKEPFTRCYKCAKYDKHLQDANNTLCPCNTCEHRKTETQVDNIMTALRRKY